MLCLCHQSRALHSTWSNAVAIRCRPLHRTNGEHHFLQQSLSCNPTQNQHTHSVCAGQSYLLGLRQCGLQHCAELRHAGACAPQCSHAQTWQQAAARTAHPVLLLHYAAWDLLSGSIEAGFFASSQFQQGTDLNIALTTSVQSHQLCLALE